MSKTVRKIGGLALVGMGIFVGVISFGVASAAAFKLVAAGLTIYASSKKPKLPGTSGSFGTELQLSGDPNAVRKPVYGEKWVAGDLRFRYAVGTNNEEFWMVIVLAGTEIDSVTGVEADRELLTLDGSGNVTSPAKWVGLMNIRFYVGSESQTADAALVSAMSGGLWTTNHRLRGLPYAVLKLTFNEELLNTPPPFRFRIRGRKVYDPKKDSTNGGSGSHRLNDPTTWEWSEDPILCQNDYDRGIYVNGKRIAGRGIATTRFDWANVIAEANVCDEPVDLAAGGDQARYTCDGIIDPSLTHGENVRMFEAAYAGESLPSDGKLRYFAGAYRTPTLHLQDQHFIGPMRHLVHRGEAARFDTAQGVYSSMAESGTIVPYSPVPLASATIGEEKILDLDLQLVSDVTNTPGVYDGGARAQRNAKLLLQKEVAGKTINLTANLYGYRAVPGETILITRSSFGLSSQAMRVLDVQLKPIEQDGKIGLVTDLVLEAGPADLYEWDAEETAIGASPELLQAQVPFDLPMGPWTPILVNVTRVGSAFTKTGGTAHTWDSAFYSQEGFVACEVTFRASQTNLGVMVGLNSDPTTNHNYTSLDFAWYAGEDGHLYIFESSVGISDFGAASYSTSDQLSISYDGLRVRYYKNGTLARTTPLVGARLFADSSFLDTGAAVNSVSLGPITHVLANAVGFAADSQGKPAGIRQGYSSTSTPDRATLSLVNGAMRIAATTTSGNEFCFPAIPVDAAKKYQLTIRYAGTVASADGLYVRFEERETALPAGKTHIGNGEAAYEAVFAPAEHDQDALSNQPFSTTPDTKTFTYVPTANVTFMSLGIWNFEPATNTSLIVEWCALTELGQNQDLLPGVLPPVDTFGLNPSSATDVYTLAADPLNGAVPYIFIGPLPSSFSLRLYSRQNGVDTIGNGNTLVPGDRVTISDEFSLIAGYDAEIGFGGDADPGTPGFQRSGGTFINVTIPAPPDDSYIAVVTMVLTFSGWFFNGFFNDADYTEFMLQVVLIKR